MADALTFLLWGLGGIVAFGLLTSVVLTVAVGGSIRRISRDIRADATVTPIRRRQ